MENSALNKKAVCFGEILWDITPEGSTPGGAPMNVAAHLQNFGVHVSMISRIGSDKLGNELESYLKTKNVNTKYIQYDDIHSTCKVQADTSDKENVKYIFNTPTAWDFIEVTQQNKKLVKEADVFVFGSLASRDEHSRKALLELLDIAKYKVFDVNFRSPFYEKEYVKLFLEKSNLAKMNEEELEIICRWFNFYGTEEEQLTYLRRKFKLEAICLTKGAEGAWLLEGDNLYKQDGFPIEVVDTIGAGDSFLATYITMWLQDKEPEERLINACAVGAVVSAFKGANPKIKVDDIFSIMAQYT